MSGGDFPLDAYLVVDNSFLVMLTEFFCESKVRTLPPARVVPTLGLYICDQLKVLQQFAPDGCIHSSQRIVAEYRPWKGARLSDMHHIPHTVKKQLARHVAGELVWQTVDVLDIAILRNQPDAPRKLVGASGLSDEDLSLVAVGVKLAEKNRAVYLLSNDQDLLEYITWLRRKPEAKELWPHVGHLQGLHSLTYLELVHRSCRIDTETISAMIAFALQEHYKRVTLAGTAKGESILGQMLAVYGSLVESAQIKAQTKGAIA